MDRLEEKYPGLGFDRERAKLEEIWGLREHKEIKSGANKEIYLDPTTGKKVIW